MKTKPGWWLFLGGFLTVALWSCVPVTEDTPVPPDDPPHENFPILGGHRAPGCEACHVDGAREQGLEPEDSTGWVTALDTGCLGCHTDTRDIIFPGGHKQQASCADSGCHGASDDCWRKVRGDCVIVPTGEPPPPIGHEGARAILFPLEGPHGLSVVAGGCGGCHTGTSDDEQRGGAETCEMCHSRPSLTHYAADRQAGTDDDRRCKACHATQAASGALQVDPSFNQGANHDFYWPHNRIDLTAPFTLRAETEWVTDCTTCHTIPGVQTASGATCDTCHVPNGTASGTPEINLSPIHQNFTGPCVACHERGDRIDR